MKTIDNLQSICMDFIISDCYKNIAGILDKFAIIKK